jgi:hypothetical protein
LRADRLLAREVHQRPLGPAADGPREVKGRGLRRSAGSLA